MNYGARPEQSEDGRRLPAKSWVPLAWPCFHSCAGLAVEHVVPETGLGPGLLTSTRSPAPGHFVA